MPTGVPKGSDKPAMFHAKERLPHLLPTMAYGSDAYFSWEMSRLFSQSWHFVALRSELSKSGDFVTVDVCGHPIQVRNVSGEIHAVSNVCAHRHCLLTSQRRGSSPKLRCQYHGWEYDATGATARIPLAQHFAPLDRTSAKIATYRVESIGQLVFVNLDQNALDLPTSLGGSLEKVQAGFGEGWEPVLYREFPQPVNWKIPIENSLEAYHVPSVHPETFRADPGEERSVHVLGDRGSWFQSTLPFAPHSTTDAWFQKVEGRVAKALTGCAPTGVYQQHQVFPNILFSFTDMISLLHVVRPTGPQTCTSVICQFGRSGKSSISRFCTRLWGRQAASITQKILDEDFRLYPAIQSGLNASRNPGMLGRSEERIHHFQKWIQNQSEGVDSQASLPTNTCAESTHQCDGTPRCVSLRHTS
jgi:choline monooxygenase